MQESDNYIGYRIRLYPTKKQREYLNRYFGIRRFVYNKAKELYDELNLDMNKNRKEGDKWNRIGKYDFYNFHFNPLRKTLWNSILNGYDSTFVKNTVFDLYDTYTDFYKGISTKPVFKSKKNSRQSFSIRAGRLSIFRDHIAFPNFREGIKVKNVPNELIGSGYSGVKKLPFLHILDARISYDGYYYWLSFTTNKDEEHQCASVKRNSTNELWKKKKPRGTIGIDLGTGRKNWIVDSDGNRVTRVDTSKEEKKIKKLQKKLSRKLEINDKKFKERNKNKGDTQASSQRNYRTKNELKGLERLNRAYKHKANKIHNQIYEYANHIVTQKPEMVVMEDLSITDMIRSNNKEPVRYRENLNRNLLDSMPCTVRTTIEYICKENDIGFMLADREYPSSQLCSSCGHRLGIGKEKVYRCPVCGMVKDRDENASINLAKYPYSNSLENIA